MEITPFDPAVVEARFFHLGNRILRGLENQAFGVRDMVGEQQASHLLSCAVLNAIAGIDHAIAAILQGLQFMDRFPISYHIKYTLLGWVAQEQIRLDVLIDFASQFAKVFRRQGENGGIISYMIGRELITSPDAS